MKNIFIFALALFAIPVSAQQFVPTPKQHAAMMKTHDSLVKLQTKQLKAQTEYLRLQVELNYAMEQAQQQCKRIALEDGWPLGATCNLQTLEFVAAPKAPAPAPAKPLTQNKKETRP